MYNAEDLQTVKAELRNDAARVLRDQAAAVDAGFALGHEFFGLGTDLMAEGKAKLRKLRHANEKYPLAGPGLLGLIRAIEDERRRDWTAQVKGSFMLADGTFQWAFADGSNQNLGQLTERSFGQLLSRSPCEEPGAAAKYLTTIPADRRAKEVNYWLEHAEAKDTMVVRSREFGGAPQVFAVVSEQYEAFDADAVAKGVLVGLEALSLTNGRAMIEYDGDRAAIRLIWDSPVQPDHVLVGEVFSCYAGFRTRDDASHSIEPFAGIYQALCRNLTTHHNRQNLAPIKHTGDQIATKFGQALVAASERVGHFIRQWDVARMDRLTPSTVRELPEGRRMDDLEMARGLFRGLVQTDRIKVPGPFRRKDQVEALTASWVDQGREATRAGIVNAITKTAHSTALRGGIWASDAMEEQAGAVLFDKRPFRWAESADERA